MQQEEQDSLEQENLSNKLKGEAVDHLLHAQTKERWCSVSFYIDNTDPQKPKLKSNMVFDNMPHGDFPGILSQVKLMLDREYARCAPKLDPLPLAPFLQKERNGDEISN